MTNTSNFNAFVDLFLKWNASINLSAATSRDDVLEHVEDSLALIPLLADRADVKRVLDVVSGGGFPVVIAALSLPSITFVALEPIHKKHAFLKTAARELHLANLEPYAERLEVHPTRDYDVATSRAAFDLLEWLTLGSQFVRPGGRVIGFEAQPRSDLGAVDRVSYSLRGKARSLVSRTIA